MAKAHAISRRSFSLQAAASMAVACRGGRLAPDFVRVSTVNPRYLEQGAGTPFIPIGPNICWPRFETGEDKVFRLYERYFDNLSANNGNYTRIWISHPFFEVEWRKAGEFDESKARRLDTLVRLAAARKIRLKFCLEHFRSLDSIPPIFPGSVDMGKPVYSSGGGGPLNHISEFFTKPEGRKLYLDRVDFLAAQYRDESSIFGWELWNEINAVRGEGWERWTRDMLPEVKQRFPNHLVMQSLGSFDRTAQFDLYRRFSLMPGNELAQAHRYLDPGAALEICRGPMDVLAADAVTVLAGYAKDRPLLLSEVGAVEANHAGPSKLYEADREGILLHDLLFAPFFAGAAGPGQSWHWHFYIDKHDLWWHFGRFAEAVRDLDPVSEQFRPFRLEHPSLRVFGLRGQSATLLWLRDAASNWHTELVEGKPASTLSAILLPLAGLEKPSAYREARCYHPWLDQHENALIQSEDLKLPDFRRSLAVRLT